MTAPAGSIGIGLTLTADDLTAKITAAVKTAMQGVLKEVTDGVKAVDAALGNVDVSGLDVVTRAAEATAAAVDSAAQASDQAAAATAAAGAASSSAASNWAEQAAAAAAAAAALADAADAAEDAADATEDVGDAADDTADSQGVLARALGSVRGSIRDFAGSTAEAVREQAKLNEQTSKGPGLLGKLGSALGGAAGMLAKISGTIAGIAGLGGVGVILTKGMNRLVAIDDAKAKLDGLGHSAESVDTIMQSALGGVKGTAYGLGDAASAAAAAVAAGVKPGVELERTIKLMGDAAAIAGTDLNSMASIFNKVAVEGKVSGDVIAQLSDRGIPAMQLLADEMGVTAAEVSKMVSSGEVDFETFQNAIEKGMGGAAVKAGQTFSGAVDNMGASLGRLGAAILDAPFKAAPGLIGSATDAVDGLTDKVGALSELLTTGDFTTKFAEAFNVEEDSGLVDWLLSIREGVIGVKAGLDLFISGDYTGKIGEALGVDEDSDLVGRILSVREMVADWGEQIGRIFGHVKDLVVGLIGPIGDIAGSFATASAAIGISTWSILLDVLETLVPILASMLIPALQALATFMQENQTLVTVLVAAYTAWKVATMAGTAAVKLAAVGLNLWTTATKVAAAAMKVFNAVMNANKITLIVTAIAALTAGIVWFFTKTETGRKVFETLKNAVTTAFDAIKRAFSAAMDFIADNWKLIVSVLLGPLGIVITQVITHWDTIKGIFIGAFDAISSAISWAWENVIKPVWEGIKTAAEVVAAVVLTVLITPLILAWDTLSAAISFAWENVIKPVFDLWASLASWLWESAIKPAWDGIKAGIDWLGAAFTWLWNNAVKPAMDGVGAAVSWVWNNVVKPTFDFIKAAIDAVGKVFTWLWNNAVKPAWDGIGSIIRGAWENVVKPLFGYLMAGIEAVGGVFKWLWDNIVKPAWDGIGNIITSVWENVIRPAWDAMKSALGSVGDFFNSTVDGIKSVWESLRRILAAPINFLINTVYNDGILKAWNAVAKFLPVSEGTPISGIPEHYTGGRIDGPGGRDNVLMWGTKDEHMLTVDEVQALGGHNLVYAMRDLITRGIPFEWDNGALIPKLGLQNMTRYGAAVQNAGIGNVPTEGLFEPLLAGLPGHATGGKIEANEPWVDQLIRAHEFARSQHGKPYQWAGPTGEGSSFDCSGYMGSIAASIQGTDVWRRYWATMSFNGQQVGPQGFTQGLGPGFSVGIFNGGPYGGHTAGTLSAVGPFSATNVESGGAPSMVKYGVGAVGADHPQFAMHYHLPIGANGFFESGGEGGPSPEQQRSFLVEKAATIINGILDPIKDGYRSQSFVKPGEFFDIPPTALDKGRDVALDAMEAVVGGLGAALSSVWNGAQNVLGGAGNAVGGILSALNPFDSGGVATGKGFLPKDIVEPERVLSPRQTRAFEVLVEALDRLSMPTAGAASTGLLDKATFESGMIRLAEAVGVGDAYAPITADKSETMDELGAGIDAQGRILSDTKSLIERTETSRERADQIRHDQVRAIFDDIVARLSDDVFVPMVKAGMAEAFGSDPAAAWGKQVSDDIVAGISSALAAQQAMGGLDLSGILGMFTGGAAFDSGGLAVGLGMMPKATIEPERVLSPSQTRAFESALSRNFAPTGIADGGVGGWFVSLLADLVGVQIDALKLINAVAKDIRSFKGTAEAAYDANGRLISDTSALLERTESSMELVEDNNRKIMRDLIVGTLVTLIDKVLIPAVTAVLSGLITAATTAIGTAIAGPVGGILGAVAGAALSGLAGLATSFIGKGLSSLVGGLFDEGGVAEGMGVMHKGTIKPERVLSPRQTAAFERLVDALEGGAAASRVTVHAPFTVKGDRRGGEAVHDRLLSLIN